MRKKPEFQVGETVKPGGEGNERAFDLYFGFSFMYNGRK